MLYHFRIQGLVPKPLMPLAAVGWIGVDLFFVLSGFLIGAQLLRPFAAGKAPSLVDFYVRRSLRILPAFLVVFLLYLFVPAWREAPGPYAPWQYLTFTWNLLMLHFPEQRAFSHVWSLCVEEHFYLILPTVLLLLRPPVRRRTAAVVFVGLLCAGIALRSWLLWHVVLAPSDDEDAPGLLTMRFLYYPTYTRLDGLVVGVALAAMRVFEPRWWHRIAGRPYLTGVAGCTFIGVALWACNWNYVDADRPWGVLFSFPLLAVGFGLLLLSAVAHQGWLRRSIPGAASIATLAFSLYLTHKSVAHLLVMLPPAWKPRGAWELLLLCIAASAVVAALLYVTVERPFLQLRSKWLHTGRATAETQPRLDPAL